MDVFRRIVEPIAVSTVVLKQEGEMRHIPATFPVKAVVTLAALICVASSQASYAASPGEDLKKMFLEMDRKICRSFNTMKCKGQGAARKSKPKTAVARHQKQKKVPIIQNRDEPKAVVPKKDAVVAEEVKENRRIPTPVLKPARITAEAVRTPVPIPVKKRPRVEKWPETEIAVLPAPARAKPQNTTVPELALPDGGVTAEVCLNRLRSQGVTFIRPATPVGTGACAVSDAVQMQSISVGTETVTLSDKPTLNCGFALTFSHWITDEASPILKSATGKAIASLGTGPGYQCRGRNGDSTAKLSEHAFGNAVDIERIKLAGGEIIEIKDAMVSSSKFYAPLAALRAAGCRYFTTVLGPGANEAHASHFHFDLQRRGKKGNHKMCQ